MLQWPAEAGLTTMGLECALGAGLDVPTPPPAEVAQYTVRTMMRTIPPAVPGIHFLSGAHQWDSHSQMP